MSDDILAPFPDDDPDELEVAAVAGEGEAANDVAVPPPAASPAELAELAAVQAALQLRQGETQVELRLDATLRVCQLLGDVQQAAPAIIVTGTNGKTSTVRMIDALLRAHGLRTGRFSSPHLHLITERMAVDGYPAPVETFVRVYEDIAPVLDLVDAELAEAGRPALTYFEALTVLAYAVFADAPVDVNVIEVGMGGEWDSTNVADAQVCVFTPVGLDHMEYLGQTVAEIAATKAGILNRTLDPTPAPHPIAVIGQQDEEAAAALAAEVENRQVDARWAGRNFQVVERTRAIDGQVIHIQTQLGDYPDIFLPLHGAYQADNAGLALAAVEAFLATEDKPLDAETVGQGFDAVTSPGRAEILRTDPTIMVDGAHNAQGAQVLARTIEDAFDFSSVVAVVAMYQDKDPYGILEHIHSFASRVVITQALNNERAMPVAELAEAAADWWDEDDVIEAADLNKALMKAIDAVLDMAAHDGEDQAGGVGIVVTGSLSTVAEARTLLGRKEAW